MTKDSAKSRALDSIKSHEPRLRSLGLTPDSIRLDASCLFGKVNPDNDAAETFFDIVDTCRLDNQGIIELQALRHAGATSLDGVAAFVPAAGAASRYFKPLVNLMLALEGGDSGQINTELENLRSQDAASWPLPAPLLKALESSLSIQPKDHPELLRVLQLPKALQPCVIEGATFLDMKLLEHRALGLQSEVYIAPVGQSQLVSEATTSAEERLPALAGIRESQRLHFFEQGPDLSTVRFQGNGELYLEASGEPSLVPAGHGSLARLFPKIKEATECHTIFIRNVDNVMGTEQKGLQATRDFIGLHVLVRQAFLEIRSALQSAIDGSAELRRLGDQSLPFLETLFTPDENSLVHGIKDPILRRLWRIQAQLFHTPLESHQPNDRSIDQLADLYLRPVNLLGQVPNIRHDIGGTPCVVRHGDASIKVCLEVPHASPADKERFLANPKKATHFNPVFVAAELTSDEWTYHPESNPFWLAAKKSYRGTDVLYRETVLYELIGNSLNANTLFVEVPRIVFNPHKVLADGASRQLSDWTTTDH